mmetsp:Transcript_37661/g.88081  ORF Transcript_37661/g.88081 Transcript_37661/m.88081 type:complete len:211 (-) Transcript_37661:31-663(-)
MAIDMSLPVSLPVPLQPNSSSGREERKYASLPQVDSEQVGLCRRQASFRNLPAATLQQRCISTAAAELRHSSPPWPQWPPDSAFELQASGVIAAEQTLPPRSYWRALDWTQRGPTLHLLPRKMRAARCSPREHLDTPEQSASTHHLLGEFAPVPLHSASVQAPTSVASKLGQLHHLLPQAVHHRSHCSKAPALAASTAKCQGAPGLLLTL